MSVNLSWMSMNEPKQAQPGSGASTNECTAKWHEGEGTGMNKGKSGMSEDEHKDK
jgi:hypothetical protein